MITMFFKKGNEKEKKKAMTFLRVESHFKKKGYLLWWVFVAARGLSLVVAIGG